MSLILIIAMSVASGYALCLVVQRLAGRRRDTIASRLAGGGEGLRSAAMQPGVPTSKTGSASGMGYHGGSGI